MSKHSQTLAHALELQGTFTPLAADGFALLNYPPCLHLAEFQADRLMRFLPLTRANLRQAFGQERGDRCWQFVLQMRRNAR